MDHIVVTLVEDAGVRAGREAKIDTDFPGGNGQVEMLAGGRVRVRPDLRDTLTPWFYWCFRVTEAAGRRLEFDLGAENLGVRGPAVSRDGGRTWAWLGTAADGTFVYEFPPDVSEVRFSVGMPYGLSDWQRFVAEAGGAGVWELGTLTRTRSGRDVPLVRIGGPRNPIGVAVTARHHACEMMASYVLEGLIAEWLSGSVCGRALRDRTDLLAVPFMDLDGVERGDQGKNRAPHDHNRDYSAAPIYPEVAAWMRTVPEWAGGRPLVLLDLHAPALHGPFHESIFFVGPEDRVQAERLERLCRHLAREARSAIALGEPSTLPFGQGFNTASPDGRRTNSAWSAALPNCLLGATLETAYANASGAEVTADAARGFGRDLAAALLSWLDEMPSAVPACA